MTRARWFRVAIELAAGRILMSELEACTAEEAKRHARRQLIAAHPGEDFTTARTLSATPCSPPAKV